MLVTFSVNVTSITFFNYSKHVCMLYIYMNMYVRLVYPLSSFVIIMTNAKLKKKTLPNKNLMLSWSSLPFRMHLDNIIIKFSKHNSSKSHDNCIPFRCIKFEVRGKYCMKNNSHSASSVKSKIV